MKANRNPKAVRPPCWKPIATAEDSAVEIESGETISNAALYFYTRKARIASAHGLVTSRIGSFRAYFRRSRAGDFESIEMTTQYFRDPN
jgi:hypothetical protein